uniref:Pleckstrin homology domain containing, family B (evectins) member 2 n=1 Tax=Oryzias latipes TaxID=8090 RepID=A0A3P9HC62_ORYLA
MAVVKSGWLHRQSTILRRWKRNWFDLWADGRLVFYNDQQRRDMEDDIHMRVSCINIRNSAACQDLTPPEGKSPDALLQIVCRDGRVISLCADRADDLLVRLTINMVVAAPQVGFTQEVMESAPHPYSEYAHPQVKGGNYIHFCFKSLFIEETNLRFTGGSKPGPLWCFPGAAVNHVVIREQQREDAGDVALGMLAGAATGLALSLFSVF